MARTRNPRFVEVYTQKLDLGNRTVVLVDTETGVNYLFHKDDNSGGMCVLIDADGRPVVTPPEMLLPR